MDRRTFLQGSVIGASALLLPNLALAGAPTDKRLVLMLLRGGLDGLHAVAPYADPDYQRLRPGLALKAPGRQHGVLDLDGHFGLHPALTPLHALYERQELLVVPATATVYRQRSHFDAQNLLENGSGRPSGLRSGWLNRALAELYGGDDRLGLALGPIAPLVLQGEVPVASWAMSPLPEADEDFRLRLARTYASDPLFAAAMERAQHSMSPTLAPTRGEGRNRMLQQAAAAAADLLARPLGPRVAVIEAQGWDTHFAQERRLTQRFQQLASAIETLRSGLQAVWHETAVLIVSEFGRTAAENGSKGTDHGVGGLALLAGGAVRGGRILGDWPGLSTRALYEGRDLRPTVATESLFKGLLLAHLEVPVAALEDRVFPDSRAQRPMLGLLQRPVATTG